MVSKENLLEKLKSRPVGPAVLRSDDPEKNFTSQIEVSGNTASVTLRDEPGTITEGTAFKFLTDEKLNPEEWEITGFRKSEWGSPTGDVLESVRYSFARKKSSAVSSVMPDLDDLFKAIGKDKPRKLPKVTNDFVTELAALADFQVGKADEVRGGTKELIERSEAARLTWAESVAEKRPQEIILADLGDAIEGFNNVASQERTNDLSLTQMIRVWRRLLWSWIDTAADLAPSVKVLSVPSNHCQERIGSKAAYNDPNNDFGIEVLTQVSDIAQANPKKFGHVKFYTPAEMKETVTLQTVGGKILGFAHGHQVKSMERLTDWLGHQAVNRSEISQADMFFFGHFHNFHVRTFGDDRWLFVAPTLDAGSTWYSNVSGNYSEPHVLSMTVDPDGWKDIKLI